MNKEFFTNNRQTLAASIENASMVILFGGNAPQKTADENYNFTPNRNFYYCTGIDVENMILVITKSNDKVEEFLYIEKSDPVLAKWVGEKMSSDIAMKMSGVQEIRYIDEFEGSINRILNSNNYNNLYLDLERMHFEDNITRPQEFAKNMINKYPYINIKNAYPLLGDLRTIKTEQEVNLIKKAIEITRDGIKNIMKNAKPGMMEYEMEAYFDFTLRSNGVRDYAFNTIAASGINGTVLHYGKNNCKAEENDLILFDVGAQYKYYNGDISRTFPVSGKFTDRQKEIYNIVLKAHNAVIDMAKPGVPFKALNEKCREVLGEECIKIGLIKEASEISKYYFHGVSHYLGLDTHDVGSRELDLAPGMVLTVEPGLYIEEEKIGIRIEDDVLITNEGHDVLSKSFLTTVDEIEEFMKK